MLQFFETKDDSDGVELSQDLLESVFYSFRLTRDAQKKAGVARCVGWTRRRT